MLLQRGTDGGIFIGVGHSPFDHCFENIFLRYTKSNGPKSIHRLGINSSSGGSRIITDNFEIHVRILCFGIRVIPYNDNLFLCALYTIIIPKVIPYLLRSLVHNDNEESIYI